MKVEIDDNLRTIKILESCTVEELINWLQIFRSSNSSYKVITGYLSNYYPNPSITTPNYEPMKVWYGTEPVYNTCNVKTY